MRSSDVRGLWILSSVAITIRPSYALSPLLFLSFRSHLSLSSSPLHFPSSPYSASALQHPVVSFLIHNPFSQLSTISPAPRLETPSDDVVPNEA